ncbi:MAG: hypothetical protein OCD76_19985 [Reichenbachiella sp.]
MLNQENEISPSKGFEISGHLTITVNEQQDEFEGKIEEWQEILIHGDTDGLRSLAKQLTYLAELNQEEVED